MAKSTQPGGSIMPALGKGKASASVPGKSSSQPKIKAPKGF